MKPLFISDLDGTLLNERGVLDAQTVDLIHRLTAAGHWFSIATARSAASAGKFLEQLRLPIPVVLMNGVVLYHPMTKEYVHVEAIPPQAAEQALGVFARGGRLPYRFSFDGQHFSVEYRFLYHPADREFARQRQTLYHRFEAVDEYEAGRNVVYLAALDRWEVLFPIVRELRALPEVSVTFYQDAYEEGMWFCECFSHRASKAVGARNLQRMLGADRLVAFGDNTNDIPLFEQADECYAVANGVEQLKSLATDIIGSNREQGVARYLAQRLENCNKWI